MIKTIKQIYKGRPWYYYTSMVDNVPTFVIQHPEVLIFSFVSIITTALIQFNIFAICMQVFGYWLGTILIFYLGSKYSKKRGIRYYYKVSDKGLCLENCLINPGVKIGSCACIVCKNYADNDNNNNNSHAGYIVCKKIKEAIGRYK